MSNLGREAHVLSSDLRRAKQAVNQVSRAPVDRVLPRRQFQNRVSQRFVIPDSECPVTQ